MARATIHVYRLEKFGYYEMHGKTPAFGSVATVLRELRGWIKDKDHDETATIRGDQESPDKRTFCLEVRANADSGDFLVTLWNETTAANSKLASLVLNSRVGDPVVTVTDPPENSATGYATYFWFIPEHDVVAAVRYLAPSGGRGRVTKYLQEFMRYFGVHPVREDGDPDPYNVKGYRAEKGGDMYPKFTRPLCITRPAVDANVVDYLHSHRASIRHVSGSRMLTFQDEVEAPRLRSLLELAGVARPKAPPKSKMPVHFTLGFTPTKEELTEMIESYEPGEGDNMSFYVSDDARTVSLETAFLRRSVEVGKPTAANLNLLDGGKLLTALQTERAGLIKGLV